MIGNIQTILGIKINANIETKREVIKMYIDKILRASDWTQIPGELSLSEQIAQQDLRIAWMELDDPTLDPDTIVLPNYPMMERP